MFLGLWFSAKNCALPKAALHSFLQCWQNNLLDQVRLGPKETWFGQTMAATSLGPLAVTF